MVGSNYIIIEKSLTTSCSLTCKSSLNRAVASNYAGEGGGGIMKIDGYVILFNFPRSGYAHFVTTSTCTSGDYYVVDKKELLLWVALDDQVKGQLPPAHMLAIKTCTRKAGITNVSKHEMFGHFWKE